MLKDRGFQGSWCSQASFIPTLEPGTAKGRVRSGGTGCSAQGQTESAPNYLSLTLLVLILARCSLGALDAQMFHTGLASLSKYLGLCSWGLLEAAVVVCLHRPGDRGEVIQLPPPL